MKTNSTPSVKELATSDKIFSINRLREILEPGDTIFSTVTEVSRNGMTRYIRFFIGNGKEVTDLTWFMAKALDFRYVPGKGLRRSGCGMDYAFSTVYDLGRFLYPNGFKCCGYEKRCMGTEHSNERKPFRKGVVNHKDGGYVFHSNRLF